MNSLHNQSGFSLIEVLIAISLLSVLLIGAEKIRLYALSFSHQNLFQSIALERLASISFLIHCSPKDFQFYYHDWNQENKKCLPNGHGTVDRISQAVIARIFWRSFMPGFWRCSIRPLYGLACDELRIAI